MMRSPRRQRGSALVLVLFVILIVTVLGLSLLFVTDVERQLGTNERVLSDTFFAAEAGVHAALASAMVTSKWSGARFATVDATSGPRLGERVVTSSVQAIGPAIAPPLTIANEGENKYFTLTVAYHVVAQRVGWRQGEPSPLYLVGDPMASTVTVQTSTSRSVLALLSPVKSPPPREVYDEDRPVDLGLDVSRTSFEYSLGGD